MLLEQLEALMIVCHTDPELLSGSSPTKRVFSYITDFLFLSVAGPDPPPLARFGCHQCYCCYKAVSGITCGARYSGGSRPWAPDRLAHHWPHFTPPFPLKSNLFIHETFSQVRLCALSRASLRATLEQIANSFCGWFWQLRQSFITTLSVRLFHGGLPSAL